MWQSIWYSNKISTISWLLWPLALVFQFIVWLRKKLYDAKFFAVYKCKLPVIVVGNIVVGGTGKTPATIFIAKLLMSYGFKPGVLVSGYGAKVRAITDVGVSSNPDLVGDEALVLARNVKCPVIIGKDRVKAVKYLLHRYNDIDIILLDDGMQHYALARDVEIAVLDQRLAGNGYYLPLGPLREDVARLTSVDLVLCRAVDQRVVVQQWPELDPSKLHQLLIKPLKLINVLNTELQLEFRADAIHAMAGRQKLYAMAGIGNPANFFNMLSAQGLQFKEVVFSDHYDYQAHDLYFLQNHMVIMTEKDAVKCKAFAKKNFWYLQIEATVADNFGKQLLNLINKSINYA